MVILAALVVIVHQVTHLVQVFARVDVLKGCVHLDPSVVAVETVVVNEPLLDAILAVRPVAARSTPPFRRMGEEPIWRNIIPVIEVL